MRTQVSWEELGIQANQDLRIHRTRVIDISESGCCFRLQREVPRGRIVAIEVMLKEYANDNLARPFLYKIIRAVVERKSRVAGAAKLQPESIWLVAFPKPVDP